MQTKRFSVILTNDLGQTFDLIYQLSPTRSAQLWYESLQKAISQSHIEEFRFYNFPNQPDARFESLIERFETVLTNLRSNFSLPKLNTSSDEALQESLNLLHRDFAHNHLIEKSIPKSQVKIWSDFNTLIHLIESALIAKKTKPLFPLGRIEFSWGDPFKFAIPENCYSEFSLTKSFGSLQIAYCQVGRHLTELFGAKDADVPKEHIQPARFFSANSVLWLGPDLDVDYEKEYGALIETWFKKSERKFNEAGVYWDRDDKALGLVTVAQLQQSFLNPQEMQMFQTEIAKYNRVLRVEILRP